MSQPREVDEDTDMAISYASRPTTGHSQQLPSFREVSLKNTRYALGLASPLSLRDIHSNVPINSFFQHTYTMKSTLQHTIIQGPNHKNVQFLATTWRIRAPYPATRQMQNYITETIANTQQGPAILRGR